MRGKMPCCGSFLRHRARNQIRHAGFIANERQRDCIIRASEAVDGALSAAELGVTPDAVGVMLEQALDAVYELSGKRAGDEVIDEVFRRFCVGK